MTAPTTTKRSRWPLYAVGLLVVVLLAALLVAHPWTGDGSPGNGADPSDTPNPQSDTVRVRRAAYIGEPVDDVVAALRDKGLKTKVETKDNPGDEDAGTVGDLSPTGTVDKGATITIEAWGDPPEDNPDDEATQTEPSDPETTADNGSGKPEKPDKTDKTEKPDNGNQGNQGNGQSAPPSPGGGRSTDVKQKGAGGRND